MIFAAAVLSFALEPIVAKAILPWFGGTAVVWTTCLVFFQCALFAGYLYAHLIVSQLPRRAQAGLHAALLVASLASLAILPPAAAAPGASAEPYLRIGLILARAVGAPFALLTATSPLLQAWLAGAPAARAPTYRLYALSNLGSMLGLASYPILIEPALTLRAQAWAWSLAYAGFVAVSLAACWTLWREPAWRRDTQRLRERPVWRWMWLWLAAAPAGLLVAVTNHILQDVAAIPLLWVIPLGLYLTSLILSFAGPRWRWRPLWYGLLPIAVGLAVYDLTWSGLPVGLGATIAVYCAALFVTAMACHGELARRGPEASGLTGYYLAVAAGGALGGLAIAVAAPLVTRVNHDLPVTLAATALLAVAALWPGRRASLRRQAPALALLALWIAGVADLAFVSRDEPRTLFADRNFYGALRVKDRPAAKSAPEYYELDNGDIDHGDEFLDPRLWRTPTTYYTPGSGVGLTLAQKARSGPLRVGVIGLGSGTLAAYARAGDVWRFYDINPKVVVIARTWFHYLAASPAPVSIVLGDARLSLESEPPQGFDVLVVDSFSGDAIPTHLLTREAFAVYARHLKPDGVLAIHVSNLYVDLAPIAALGARARGWIAREITNDDDDATDTLGSDWVLASADASFFARPALAKAETIPVPRGLRPWTDDYSSLWPVLRAPSAGADD